MLIRRIERFLRDTEMSRTTFVRLAVRDPRFVHDLRKGREPGPQTEKKVEHFMNIYRKDAHAN